MKMDEWLKSDPNLDVDLTNLIKYLVDQNWNFTRFNDQLYKATKKENKAELIFPSHYYFNSDFDRRIDQTITSLSKIENIPMKDLIAKIQPDLKRSDLDGGYKEISKESILKDLQDIGKELYQISLISEKLKDRLRTLFFDIRVTVRNLEK